MPDTFVDGCNYASDTYAYVQVEREEGRRVYHCRPLRGPQIATRDPLLSVALSKLGNKMCKLVGNWIERGEVSRIGAWLYDSALHAVSIKLMLALRDRTLRWKLLVVCTPAFSRLIAFSPSIPDVSLNDSIVDLELRASEVYAEWAQCRSSRGVNLGWRGLVPVERCGLNHWRWRSKRWSNTSRKTRTYSQHCLAANESAAMYDKVGQCLDEFITDYQPAIGLRQLVDEVDRLLHREDRQGLWS